MQRRLQIFQAPVSQGGHLGRVLSQSPQTHQATRNPKGQSKTRPGSRVPSRLGCGTQGSAKLFLLPDPTSSVRTECDLQTRRAGAGGGRAQAQVRLGGPTGTGSLPLSPSVAASAAVRTDRGIQRNRAPTPGRQGASSLFRLPARPPTSPPASRFHLRLHPPSSQAPKAWTSQPPGGLWVAKAFYGGGGGELGMFLGVL